MINTLNLSPNLRIKTFPIIFISLWATSLAHLQNPHPLEDNHFEFLIPFVKYSFIPKDCIT